ncbi:four helix bundle protein [Nitrosophilus kaiyonis]|uniref:four helix bundle protein n=1 Tax=Nitrosophilus kaiyonis TaxID=2930200 RepID=UPI00248FFF1B|nr:four helix bundle protein [Nitrosophilus kaiyonis]
MTGYEKLNVWQKSMELVTEIYKLVKKFPKEEMFALSDQIRRSAVSIPSNIAKGSSRNSKKEFIQFLYISLGSICELETQLKINENVGYLNSLNELFNKTEKIKKMINALITSLKKDLKND